MGWIALALTSAVFVALGNAVVKRVSEDVDAYGIAWGVSAVAAVLLWGIVFVRGGTPDLAPWVVGILAASGGLNILTLVFKVKGLHQTEFSVAGPLLATTPAFLLLISPAVLGETPSLLGIAGVLVIVAGSYLLEAHGDSEDLLDPIRGLIRDHGPRLVLIAAVAASFTAAVDKMGVRATSGAVWAAAATSAMTLGLAPLVLFEVRGRWRSIRVSMAWAWIGLAGVLLAVASLTNMLALELGLAAYVIALKRVSAPISVVIGRLGFGDERFRQRLLGSAVILVGIILVAMS